MEALSQQLAALSAKAGPAATDAALAAVQVAGVGILMSDAVAAVIGLLFVWAAWRLYGKAKAANNSDVPGEDDMVVGMVAVAGACGVVAAVILVSVLLSLCSPWTWAALLRPDVYLAKQVLGL